MEFFEYLRIPQYILQFAKSSGGVSVKELYILFGVAGGAYLICLVIGGLALFAMAERAGIKHSWLGFIPFANTYYAGKIAGESSFFGRKMKRAGLYAMIAEIVYAAFEIMSIVISVLLSSNASYYETNYLEGSSVPTLIFNLESVPKGMQWMAGASTWFSILSLIANLVMLVFLCAVYNGLYRKYSPKNAYAMTVFSVILPIRAFILFAVRNKEPVDYDEYMKKRIEQAMQSAGMTLTQVPKPDEPFSDFDDRSSSDPFSDFEESSQASPFSEFDDYPPSDSETPTDSPYDSDSDGSDGFDGE